MDKKTIPAHTPPSPPVELFLRLFRALMVIIILSGVAFLVYQNATNIASKHPFKLGLDLAGGSHLVYEADVTNVNQAEVSNLMDVLRTVIERRINIFGVSEPIVQVEESSFVSGQTRHRLVVELPGVTDVGEAIAEIGRTPLLEFKLIDEVAFSQVEAQVVLASSSASGTTATIDNNTGNQNDPYIVTGLTGRYLKSAALEFTNGQSGSLANEPIVSIRFTEEGGKLFEEITKKNVGARLAIFLDGEVISSPRINEAISGGTAIISGNFNPQTAKDLAQNLNFGALPVPITLQSTQTIGASLGLDVLQKGLIAGVIGLVSIIGFMVLWYRLLGLIAGIALLLYVTIMLALFQYIPVTLTAAGLAGFILSLGIAVDANVLVFERMKEEFRSGKGTHEAARVGFSRAWFAIRDGNATSILSAIILFWFGTSMVKGFALVFGIGTLVSMLTALTLTRTLLMTLPDIKNATGGWRAWLFNSGIFTK